MNLFFENLKFYETMSILIDSSKLLSHSFHHVVLFSNTSCIHNVRNVNVIICLHVFDFVFLICIILIFFVVFETIFFFSQIFAIDDDVNISSRFQRQFFFQRLFARFFHFLT